MPGAHTSPYTESIELSWEGSSLAVINGQGEQHVTMVGDIPQTVMLAFTAT